MTKSKFHFRFTATEVIPITSTCYVTTAMVTQCVGRRRRRRGLFIEHVEEETPKVVIDGKSVNWDEVIKPDKVTDPTDDNEAVIETSLQENLNEYQVIGLPDRCFEKQPQSQVDENGVRIFQQFLEDNNLLITLVTTVTVGGRTTVTFGSSFLSIAVADCTPPNAVICTAAPGK